MSDEKIIDINQFRKKMDHIDPKEHITVICSEIMCDIMRKVNGEGYDINDPDFLYDLEILTRLIVATICRQSDIKNLNIDILDRLREEDGEEH